MNNKLREVTTMNNKMVRKHTFRRVIKTVFKAYPVMVPFIIMCIIFSAVVAAMPDVILPTIIKTLETAVNNKQTFDEVLPLLSPSLTKLIIFYVAALILTIIQTQMLAYMTQGYLSKMRIDMFNKMQNLPIRFFDSNKHGDIMSYYTNDIDTLRELVSQSLPAIIRAVALVSFVFGVMLWWSIWLTLIVVGAVILMLIVSRVLGKNSSKYFIKTQINVGKMEAYAQEMMNGQKVVKVFNHEYECIDGFNSVTDDLYDSAYKSNAYANMLGPIIMNIGNILYVVIAVVGAVFCYKAIDNFSLSGVAMGLPIIITFLQMTRQFTANVNQVSQQFNSIIMSMAGAGRVFSLIDQPAETDEGYVELVNAVIGEDGSITETEEHTGHWAWKHPHQDGTLTYTKLEGDVVLENVTFGYEENKIVLHNVNVFARPGQKVAFVGATGAGKTTITNLINRFYDINDGKIRYDGINIQKIKKNDLRKSLGLVLQDTFLFTGTVLDNIRYGKLDATDEECITAAKLAGADDFITRLPEGYQTLLTNNGANLSQGQRQLLAIARAAVADPPVMILDEATSSIDTRTEAIVQRGMDKLMEGRTVFVIAHRLSTVMNADVIMVLDHGVIIERGTHEQLLEQKGTYYQLYTGAFELE